MIASGLEVFRYQCGVELSSHSARRQVQGSFSYRPLVLVSHFCYRSRSHSHSRPRLDVMCMNDVRAATRAHAQLECLQPSKDDGKRDLQKSRFFQAKIGPQCSVQQTLRATSATPSHGERKDLQRYLGGKTFSELATIQAEARQRGFSPPPPPPSLFPLSPPARVKSQRGDVCMCGPGWVNAATRNIF